MSVDLSNLTARQKAAILLVALPAEVSAPLCKELGPQEVQELTMEINRMPEVSPEVRAQVIDEFLRNTKTSVNMGDMNPAAGQTTRPMSSFQMGGPSFSGTSFGSSNRPMGSLRRIAPRDIIHLIRREHAQTIAVVLSYLETNQASAVLGELNPTLQTEVARRLAELDKISPEIIQELEQILESKLQTALDDGFQSQMDGKDTLLEILNQADRNTEEKILSGLTHKNPHLVTDLKTKLCDFEDLNSIDDASLQQVLRLTDFRDLVLALKGANRDLGERVYKSLSSDVAKALKDDVDSLGQAPWEEVTAAKRQIRNILRGLVTLGKIRFR
jgi:flagellar motor switch protein FliG